MPMEHFISSEYNKLMDLIAYLNSFPVILLIEYNKCIKSRPPRGNSLNGSRAKGR